MRKLNIHIPSLKKNGQLLGFGSSAKRDWKIIFYASALVGLVMILFCVYTFMNIKNSTQAIEQVTGPTLESIDPATLKKVVSFYAERQKTLHDLVTNPTKTTDPSK